MGTFLLFCVYITSLILIILVSMQTTKSEGFAGLIGGGVQASVKYLPGQEEVLQMWTSRVAGAWMFFCLAWYVVSNTIHH